ncbi:PIG-L deacetylase family protein [Chloroflexota bacterium]
MITEQAHVIVFIPHPDDAESRMAGTVALWVREGKNIVYVVCTNGDKGTSDPNMKPEELARIREREQLAAAKLLGVREVVFLRYPDQGLEDTPEFRKEIVRLIRMYKPDTVVTVDPYRGYLDHRDHRITARVTLDAIFPYASAPHSYPDLLEQRLQPHKVKEILFCGVGDPNYYVNVTDMFDIKVAALRCHESQVGDRPELEEQMRQRARMTAEGQDYELAEAFHSELVWVRC